MRLVLRLWSMMAYAAFEIWLLFFFFRLETEYLREGARGRGGRLMMKGAGLEGGKEVIWRINRCFNYSGFVYTLHHQVLM